MFDIKKTFLGVVFILLLSACNITSSGQNSDISLEDIVHTRAAETVQADGDARTATQAALFIPTDTLTPTETPTLTFTPTNTPTTTPTRTLVPNDPRANYGEPDWIDPFDDSGYWSTHDNATTRTDISGGKFLYTAYQANSRIYWTISWPTVGNFYMEITIQNPAECSGKDQVGIIFRAPDTSQGYLLSFACDGEYQLMSWSNGGISYPIPWKASTIIDAGPNQVNRLGIQANGDQLTVYANGVALNTAIDQTFRTSGRFGLFISSQNTDNLTFTLDEMMYWVLP